MFKREKQEVSLDLFSTVLLLVCLKPAPQRVDCSRQSIVTSRLGSAEGNAGGGRTRKSSEKRTQCDAGGVAKGKDNKKPKKVKRSKAWKKVRREQKHKEIAETIMKNDVVESPEPEEREEDDDEAAQDSEGSLNPTTPPRTCPSPTAALSPMPEMPSACGL